MTSLAIEYEGRVSRFTSRAIDRRSLHGCRRRLALDAEGNECATAHLTQDGRFLLGKGCAVGLYLDEAGDVVDRRELAAVDSAGNGLDDASAAYHRRQSTAEPATFNEFLDHVAVATHLLVPESVDLALDTALRHGEIFRLSSDGEAKAADQPVFLLANSQGFFLLEMQYCGFEYASLEQSILDAEELSMVEAGDEFSFDWEAADEPA